MVPAMAKLKEQALMGVHVISDFVRRWLDPAWVHSVGCNCWDKPVFTRLCSLKVVLCHSGCVHSGYKY